MKRLVSIILATLLIIIVLSIQTIAFESAAPPVMPTPSIEEEIMWERIRDRVIANKERWTHNIDDVLKSFNEPIDIIINCENSEKGIKQVRIQITSTFVEWTDECGHVVGCYMWRGATNIKDGIKSIFADNMLILNYDILMDEVSVGEHLISREWVKIGQMDNEGIVFHELLHGQLLIDAMKNDENWRSGICNCSANIDVAGLGRDGKLTEEAKKIHQKIYDLQDGYVEKITVVAGGTIIKRTIQVNANTDGTFDMELDYEKELKDKKEAKDLVYWISPVENIEDLYEGGRIDYKIKFGGEVGPGKNEGRVRVLVDPDLIGVIDNILILVPTASPTLPPGHPDISLEEEGDIICTRCHPQIRGSSLNLPILLILGACILAISLFMIKRKRN